MKILNFSKFRDGGTIEVMTDEGIYCFDNRIMSKTKNKLYNGYPLDDNSNLIKDSVSIEIENRIVEALKDYKNEFYQSTIDHFLKVKKDAEQLKLVSQLIRSSNVISTAKDMNGNEGAACYIQVDKNRINEMATILNVTFDEMVTILETNFGYKK